METFDVVVVGLGVHGSATARELAMRGLRVLGVEQSPETEVWGASCGPARMVREVDVHRPKLTALAIESVARWNELSLGRTTAILRPVTGIFVGIDQPAPGQGLTEHLAPVSPDSPWLIGLTDERRDVLADLRCGLLDAPLGVRALRSEARGAGADLVFGRKAVLTAPSKDGRPVTVRVGSTVVRAEQVLICTGAWAAEGPAWARPDLRVVPAFMQVATWSGGLGGLSPDCFYVFYETGQMFCVIPLVDGQRLQFGHFSLPVDAEDMSAAALARATWLRDSAVLRRYVPNIGHPVRMETVHAAYSFPPADEFALRWLAPGIATLTACSGVGFKYAPSVAARVASVLGQRGEPRGDVVIAHHDESTFGR
ncbi:NAD(P)/FAD-dependent oxidoreductase [Micromonospora sp. NPDC050397]|uniref:NAD(P)/FAD-dependent oxidoreductase n=1 Tax=Micromonospora sp. NPDC050397 TaxID=3364279 RepID=UPI00384D73E4